MCFFEQFYTNFISIAIATSRKFSLHLLLSTYVSMYVPILRYKNFNPHAVLAINTTASS